MSGLRLPFYKKSLFKSFVHLEIPLSFSGLRIQLHWPGLLRRQWSLQLWHRLSPWPGNSHVPRMLSFQKKKKKRRSILLLLSSLLSLLIILSSDLGSDNQKHRLNVFQYLYILSFIIWSSFPLMIPHHLPLKNYKIAFFLFKGINTYGNDSDIQTQAHLKDIVALVSRPQ